MSSKPRSRSVRRHNPLADDLIATGNLRVKSNKRKVKAEEEEDRYVDSRSSRKILKIGQELVDEDQKENAAALPNPAFGFTSRFDVDSESAEDLPLDEDDGWGDEEGDTIQEVVGYRHKLHVSCLTASRKWTVTTLTFTINSCLLVKNLKYSLLKAQSIRTVKELALHI